MSEDQPEPSSRPVIRAGIPRRQLLATALAGLGASLVAGRAVGQTRRFPDRPIKIIVPFPAGGGIDAFARLVGEKLRQTRGYATAIDARRPSECANDA